MTHGISKCFPLFLAILTLLPVGSSAERIRGTVLVMLQNDANVPANVAAAAQAEVVRLFGLADMEVVWVTRVPAPGIRLRVISTVTWEPREEKMATVLGLTYGNHDTRATRGYVFWGRIERAASKFTAALHKVLAVAISHELGHMLLPEGSHAKTGIMAAPWNREHFGSASAGLLHFSRDTAALMSGRLTGEPPTGATRE